MTEEVKVKANGDSLPQSRTVVIINPQDVREKNWLYNTFLKKFLIAGGKKTRVNMLLEDVTDEEVEQLVGKGIHFVDVSGGDIVYPEVILDRGETERLEGELERAKFLIQFYDTLMNDNLTDKRLGKIMDENSTTMVNGGRVRNFDILSEAYVFAIEANTEQEDEEQ